MFCSQRQRAGLRTYLLAHYGSNLYGCAVRPPLASLLPALRRQLLVLLGGRTLVIALQLLVCPVSDGPAAAAHCAQHGGVAMHASQHMLC